MHLQYSLQLIRLPLASTSIKCMVGREQSRLKTAIPAPSGQWWSKQNENYKHLNLRNFRISGRNLASRPWPRHGAGSAGPVATRTIKVAGSDGGASGESGSQASGAGRVPQNDLGRSLEAESRPE